MEWKKPIVDGWQFSQPRAGEAVTSPVLNTILMHTVDDRREFAPTKTCPRTDKCLQEAQSGGGGRWADSHFSLQIPVSTSPQFNLGAGNLERTEWFVPAGTPVSRFDDPYRGSGRPYKRYSRIPFHPSSNSF